MTKLRKLTHEEWGEYKLGDEPPVRKTAETPQELYEAYDAPLVRWEDLSAGMKSWWYQEFQLDPSYPAVQDESVQSL